MSPSTEAEIDIAPARAAEMLGAGAQLIDVRRPDEWEAGRIAGARHIELERLPSEAAAIDRDRPVIFQCRVGNRSAMATDAFREAGYEAYNLAGGIAAWVESGLAIEPQDGHVVERGPA